MESEGVEAERIRTIDAGEFKRRDRGCTVQKHGTVAQLVMLGE